MVVESGRSPRLNESSWWRNDAANTRESFPVTSRVNPCPVDAGNESGGAVLPAGTYVPPEPLTKSNSATPKPLMLGDGLSSGDGLGNGFDVAGALTAGDGVDGVADGCATLAAAGGGPPGAPIATASMARTAAAAMLAALVNDQAFFAVFLAKRDF